jgi:nicotinamide-nucleotide amidase
MPDEPAPWPTRPILTAELLAVGTELTVGETSDTNSGDLARSLTAHGVVVGRISDLPDDLPVVVDALRAALRRADLVVTTGGLGPTPDDLTREAVAEACAEPLSVDADTLEWLRERWRRRRLPFPETNIKQAWLIPSATGLPNPHGSAPGWWVDRPDGRVIVLLPGPPREMRPMWSNKVLPRLAARGVGGDTEVRTLRLHGIGESQLAAELGDALLRAANPVVATYARHEAVDVRISARAAEGRSAAELADAAEAAVLAVVEPYVWARGETTWAAALGAALAARGWTLATSERGARGALAELLRGLEALRRAEVVNDVAGASSEQAHAEVEAAADEPPARRAADEGGSGDPETAEADRIRRVAGADVGLSMSVRPAGEDTDVRIGIATPAGSRTDHRLAFMRGGQGADRAAIATAAALLAALRELG